MAKCKAQASSKELNQRLKRITDDLQDVHSKLNTVVAQQRRLDLPSIPRTQGFKRRYVPGSQDEPGMLLTGNQKMKSAVIPHNDDLLSDKSDISDADDETSRPKIASSIVSTKPVIRTREDLIGLINQSTLALDGPYEKEGGARKHCLTADKEMAAVRPNLQLQDRNKRMLGLMINTLNEFKKQNDSSADQGARRCQEVEDKRRRRAEEENVRLQQERHMLVERKRMFLSEQRNIMAELERLERIQYWTRTGECLHGFIQTVAKPEIFWRPGLLEAKAKRRLDQSQVSVQDWVSAKIAEFRKPLADADAARHHLNREEQAGMHLETGTDCGNADRVDASIRQGGLTTLCGRESLPALDRPREQTTENSAMAAEAGFTGENRDTCSLTQRADPSSCEEGELSE